MSTQWRYLSLYCFRYLLTGSFCSYKETMNIYSDIYSPEISCFTIGWVIGFFFWPECVLNILASIRTLLWEFGSDLDVFSLFSNCKYFCLMSVMYLLFLCGVRLIFNVLKLNCLSFKSLGLLISLLGFSGQGFIPSSWSLHHFRSSSFILLSAFIFQTESLTL